MFTLLSSSKSGNPISSEKNFEFNSTNNVANCLPLLLNYSFAKYKNRQLISQFGKYQYNLTTASFDNSADEYLFQELNKYHHLIYHPDAETIVVISKPAQSIAGIITTFSYLFSFFSLIVLSLLFARQMLRGSVLAQLSFKYRIQFLLVVIVLISLALFGGGTIFYIKQQYHYGH